MKYRSADIVEPNGIRSARTDWWNCVVQRETRAASHTSANRINLPLSPPPVWNCLLTGPPFDFHLSRNSTFWRWSPFNCTGNAANPGDPYTRPNPRLFIHPQWTTWTSWIFDRPSWFSGFVNDIRAIGLLFRRFVRFELDYHRAWIWNFISI